MQVLWVYGPAGVGKSTTAWQVLELLAPREPTAYVDIDQLGMLVPAPAGEDDWAWAHRLKARALAAVAPAYAAHGATTLVVSGVLDPALMDEYDERLAAHDLAFVRLAVGPDELRRRMAARGQDAEDWADVEAEARELEAAGLPHPVVVPDGSAPEHVAAEVVERARFRPARPAAAPEQPPPTVTDARALLVTGAESVGKSTVGWSAFTATWGGPVPTAFVDLRQLGFLGAAGGPLDDRLQVATTAAVWQVFREAGAGLLLLNGAVADLARVADYAAALGAPLTAVRLTADREALRERVRARARGEGARLAGDGLLGLTDRDVEAVVDRSLAAQAATRPHSDVLDLDTSGLTPDEAGAAVLSAARCRVPGRAG